MKEFLFSIKKAKDVTANLINVTTAVQDLKIHDDPNEPVIWLRKFMKEQNINYVKESHLEGIQFT